MARAKKSHRSKERRKLDEAREILRKTAVKKSAEQRQATTGLDENIAHMDTRLLADLFAQKIRRHRGDLTAVEMNDLYLPADAFLDTSKFSAIRNLSSLSSFLKVFTSGGAAALSTTCEGTSNPHTILITSSGIRATDLTRALREFQSKDTMVAKLFAKHIKLDEAIKQVQKARIGIGIGTPARVKDLLNAQALETDNLARIVIDGSYVDQKKRTILDMKDLFEPLLEILRRPELAERYGKDEHCLKLLVY